MDLETLRIQMEAKTGSAIRDLKALEKVLSSQAAVMQTATSAAKEFENASAAQVASMRAWAAQARAANVQTENGARATRAYAETLKRAAQGEVSRAVNMSRTKDIIRKNAEMVERLNAASKRLDVGISAASASLEKGGEKTKAFGERFFGAMQKAFFFMSAVDRVRGALSKLYDVTEEAARANTAQMWFEDSGKSLERLRDVSKGMVSNANLVKKANLADSMGLSSATFERLILVAQAAAAKTGQSFDHMFDSIVLGTARSSRLLLDNLGIIVNVKEAQRRYAEEAIKNGEAHGKTVKQVVEAMSDEAKKAAFLQDLYRQTTNQVEKLNQIGSGGAAVFDKFSAAMDNLKQVLATKVLPVLSTTLTMLTDILQRMSRAAGANLEGIRYDPKSETYDLGGTRVSKFQEMTSVETRMFERGEFKRKEKTPLEVLNQFGQATLDTMRQLRAMDPKLKLLENGTVQLMEGEKDLTREFNQLAIKFNALNEKTKLFYGPASNNAKPSLFGDGEDSGSAAARKAQDRYARALFKGAEDEDKAVAKHIQLQLDAAEEREAEYWRLLRISQKAAAEADRIERARLEEQARWHDAYLRRRGEAEKNAWQESLNNLKELATGIRSIMDAVAGVLTGSSGIASAGLGLVSSPLGGVVGGALGGPGGAVMGEAIGGGIGDILGTMLDKLPGMQALTSGLSEGFLNMFSKAFGPVTDVLLNLKEPIYQLMTAFGVLLSAAIEPLAWGLRALIPFLPPLIRLFAGLIVAVAPLFTLVSWFMGVIWVLTVVVDSLAKLAGLGNGVFGLIEVLDTGSEMLLRSFINFHNAVLSMIRKIPALEDYGTMLRYSDFELPGSTADDGTEDNTDAVKENTRAVRDLAREFHNLPSGYKGNAAAYNAANNERPWWMNDSLAGAVGRSTGISSRLMPPPPTRQNNPYRG